MTGLLATNLQDIVTVRIFVTVQFSKLLLKKTYTTHPMMYNKGICFVMKMMDKKSVLGVLVFTQDRQCFEFFPHLQFCCLSYR